MEGLEWGGFYPGVLGEMTWMHGAYYHANWGFDQSFEIEVGRELTEFAKAFDPERDAIVTARSGGRLAGAIAVDGSDAAGQGARLRWFIVAPEHAGRGLGKAILGRAMRFLAERPYPRAFLWTFSGLDAARSLYERNGFVLTIEQSARKWGGVVAVQKFEAVLRELP